MSRRQRRVRTPATAAACSSVRDAHLRSVARPDAVVPPLGLSRRCCSAARSCSRSRCASSSTLIGVGLPGQRRARSAAPAIFGMMIWLLYIRFIVPVLGVFYGTSLIADEVEDKTITYLFTRPIPRSAVLVGKYLAYLACTVLLVLPSVVLVFFLVVPTRRQQHRRGVSRAGRRSRRCWRSASRPTARCSRWSARASSGRWSSGLVFAFGWEPAVLLFPGLPEAADGGLLPAGARPARDAAGLGRQRAAAGIPRDAVGCGQPAGLAVITAVTLWAAGRAVENREYVLEQ